MEGLPSFRDHAASEAEMMVSVVDDTVLSRGDTLDALLALQSVTIIVFVQEPAGEFGCMSDFEGHRSSFFGRPKARLISILGDEVESIHLDSLAVLGIRVVPSAHEDDIAFDIFLDHEPRTAAQPQAFALTDRVEPVALMATYDLARFQFDYPSFFSSQIPLDEAVVVYLAEEAYPLTVFPLRAGQAYGVGDGAHLGLHQMSDGEHELGDLSKVDLCQEIGLILDRVESSGQIRFAIEGIRCGVMTGGNAVELIAALLLEAAKFDELIAHHIRIGRQSLAHSLHRVAYYSLPVFLVEVDDLERAAVTTGNERSQFYILLGGTVNVAVLIFHTDADIEDGRLMSFLA